MSTQRSHGGNADEGSRKRQARAKFDAGVERIRDAGIEGGFEQGCALFRESQRLFPSPDATRLIAVCLSQEGRPVEALEALEVLQRLDPLVYLFPTDWASSPHELTERRISELIEQLQAKIAHDAKIVPATREVATGPAARATLAVPALVTTGVGVALVTAGVLIGNHALSLEDELAARCPSQAGCDPALRSDYDDARRHALTANLMLGAGAIAMVTGLGLYLIQLGRPEEPATFTAGCMLHGCVVSTQGAF
jgi:hypothetical protein